MIPETLKSRYPLMKNDINFSFCVIKMKHDFCIDMVNEIKTPLPEGGMY